MMNIFSAIVLASAVFAGSVHGLSCNNFAYQRTELSVMGHEPLIFTGDCFNDCTASIECTFFYKLNGNNNSTTTTGLVDKSLFELPRAICYSPYLYTPGQINVQVKLVKPNPAESGLIDTIPVTVVQSPAPVKVDILGSSLRVEYTDLTKVSVTPAISLVDIMLVVFNPTKRSFQDLFLVQSDVPYLPGSTQQYAIPDLNSLQRDEAKFTNATLATTYVALAVRPMTMSHGPHPFHPQAAVFSPFMPILMVYPELKPVFKTGVCNAWFYNQKHVDHVNMPYDCPADRSAIQGDTKFVEKKQGQHSSTYAKAFLGSQSSQQSKFVLTAPLAGKTVGQECYYDSNNLLVSDLTQGAGAAQRVSPYFNEIEHYYEDEVSWYACCHEVEGSDTCKNYYVARKPVAQ